MVTNFHKHRNSANLLVRQTWLSGVDPMSKRLSYDRYTIGWCTLQQRGYINRLSFLFTSVNNLHWHSPNCNLWSGDPRREKPSGRRLTPIWVVETSNGSATDWERSRCMGARKLLLPLLHLIPTFTWVDVRWHTPPCITVVHIIRRQSFLFDIILYFVQPSSLVSSSLPSQLNFPFHYPMGARKHHTKMGTGIKSENVVYTANFVLPLQAYNLDINDHPKWTTAHTANHHTKDVRIREGPLWCPLLISRCIISVSQPAATLLNCVVGVGSQWQWRQPNLGV